MPIVRIDFDRDAVDEEQVKLLSEAVQKIVVKETGIEDVIVYANDAQIKVKAWPIEIFVQMSEQKVVDEDTLFESLKSRIVDWKKASGFSHPINLTFIPMKWKIEVGL